MNYNGKRKRGNLSIEDRVKILERLDKGEKEADLAQEYNVTKAAIAYMKKAKEILIKKRNQLIMCHGTTSKKRCTGIENTNLDQALYKWFLEQKNNGQLVTTLMMQKKALEFNEMFNGTNNFKASTGFLDKFKRRYNISFTSKDDANYTDQDECDNFCLKLPSDNDECSSNHELTSDNDECLSVHEFADDNDDCLSIHEQELKVLNDEEVFLSEQCKYDTNCEKHEAKESKKDIYDVHFVDNSTAGSAFEGIDTFMSWYQTQDCSPQDWQHLWKFWKHALNEVIKNKNESNKIDIIELT